MQKEQRNLIIATILILVLSLELTLQNIIQGSGLHYLLGGALGLFLLVNSFRALKPKDLLGALGLVFLANLYFLYREGTLSILSLFLVPAYLGSVGVIRKYHIDYSFRRYVWTKTLAMIGLVASLLATFNTLLISWSSTAEAGWHMTWANLFLALVPGIYEEILCRFVFLGLIFYLLKRKPQGYLENFCTYILLIVPHVLFHYSGSIPFMPFLIQAFCFGLPLAYLLKEVDLLTPMSVHTLIDWIRFILFNG